MLLTAISYFKKLFLDDPDHQLMNSMNISLASLVVLRTAVASMYGRSCEIKDVHVLELLKLSINW